MRHRITTIVLAFGLFAGSNAYAGDYSSQYMPLLKEKHDAQCVLQDKSASPADRMDAQQALMKSSSALSQLKMKFYRDTKEYGKYSKAEMEIMKAPCGNIKAVSAADAQTLMKEYTAKNCQMIGSVSDPMKQAKYASEVQKMKEQIKNIQDRLKLSGNTKAYNEFKEQRRNAEMGMSCK